MTGLAFPDVSPVMFSIGGFAVRWYSVGLSGRDRSGLGMAAERCEKISLDFDKPAIEDVVFYVTIGICRRPSRLCLL